MCIEYNEYQYGGMYNVYVKRIFFIIEIVHMIEKTGTGVSYEKEKVKESQSVTVTKLDTLARHPIRVPGQGRHNLAFCNKKFHFFRTYKILTYFIP